MAIFMKSEWEKKVRRNIPLQPQILKNTIGEQMVKKWGPGWFRDYFSRDLFESNNSDFFEEIVDEYINNFENITSLLKSKVKKFFIDLAILQSQEYILDNWGNYIIPISPYLQEKLFNEVITEDIYNDIKNINLELKNLNKG
ncbi:hypothetical protein AAEX28_07310 [Lentisphaerota bacterium WC36G]|nr:hypothetical protein LJT99_10170 [Lentisphaerae bacterium WC36]